MIPVIVVPEEMRDMDPPESYGNEVLGSQVIDLFISHAYEDKDIFVRPLVRKLEDLGIQVWYDEYSLKVGDSLSRAIDKGLASCRFGLVVISGSFISKHWTEYELRGLIAREIGFGKLILPVWHQVTKKDVLEFSPPLADKVALDSSAMSVNDMALRILSVVKPDSYENLSRWFAYRKWQSSQPIESTPIEDISFNLLDAPFIHETLPEEFLRRLLLMHQVLLPVFPISWEQTVNNFRRDHHPKRELVVWERIASTFLTVTRKYPLGIEQIDALFGNLLGWSMKNPSREQVEAENPPDWLMAAYYLFQVNLPLDRDPID